MTVPESTCAACGQPLSPQGCPQHGWSASAEGSGAPDGGYRTDARSGYPPPPPSTQSYLAPLARGYSAPPARGYSAPPAPGYALASDPAIPGERPTADAAYNVQPYAVAAPERVAVLPAGYGGQPPPPAARSGSGFRDRLPLLTAIGVLILVILVVGQFVLQAGTNSRLHDTQRDLAAEKSSVQSLQSEQGALSRRASALEAQAKGTLNPSQVAKDVLPSVFRVRAGNEIGTAFAVGQAPSGGGTLLVTNYHVIANLQASGGSAVTLQQGNNSSYAGTVLRGDEQHDLAVIKMNRTIPRLTAAAKTIQPGDPVVAIGSPLGLTNTITSGIVSGLRSVPGLESEGEKIQFDAAINPGNSGGPVVNAGGQVVGVAQIKIIGSDKTAEGLALAIPITEVCQDLISC